MEKLLQAYVETGILDLLVSLFGFQWVHNCCTLLAVWGE